MKKALLFSLALCCMMSAMAQKSAEKPSLREKAKKVELLNRSTNAYTQKLDSIVTSLGSTNTSFYYDSHFNIVKITTQVMNTVMMTTEYTYDNQDRCISVIENYWGETHKTNYSYNAQDLISQEITYEQNSGAWIEDEKIVYEYDNNGNMLSSMQYDFDDNNWKNDGKVEYTYLNDRLAKTVEYNWDYDTWREYEKVEYEYNNAGDCTQTIYYHYFGGWDYDDKEEYTYDANHNCISQTSYDYSMTTQNWVIDNEVFFTYDLAVSSDVIAGMDFLNNSVISINNKLVSVKEIDYDNGQPDETALSDLYYSAASEVVENNSTQLNIWPNPTSETLSVKAEGLQQVDIFTMDGKHVAKTVDGFETIDVRALTSGYYLLKATFENGAVSTQKFVKQ